MPTARTPGGVAVMHRRRQPEPLHVDPRPVFARIVWLNASGNILSGLSLTFGDPGISGTFALMALVLPLPVWGAALTVAGLLQATGGALVVWGHGIGGGVWLGTAAAALSGLALGVSTSGAGSLMLAGLLITVAGLHMNGIWFRRQEAIAARRGEQ